jgi:perosamine synthetase
MRLPTQAHRQVVDSVSTTWQMDPEDIRRHIAQPTIEIMVIHLYGQACDMDAIMILAREYRLFLVEDCAEAFGTLYKGRHVDTFSFFGNKTITTGQYIYA